MKRIFNYSQVGFAVGTGRCGTKFLSRVLSMEPGVSSVHERNPLNETFHRYCKWYQLPVDDEGFLHAKELEIQNDLKDHFFSFEASAHLSLSIGELFNRFGAKFILLVRSPERVINSYLNKGWYNEPLIRRNLHLALGYQKSEYFHRFLGRIVPLGKKYLQWNKLTRVGKLAWYWSALNASVLKQFEKIPKTHWRVEKLEELSYNRYLEVAKFLGYQATLTEKKYNDLARSRPNAIIDVPTIASWNPTEIVEFESEITAMAEKLGYEYRVDHLPIPKQTLPKAKKYISKKFHRREYSLKKLAGKFIR